MSWKLAIYPRDPWEFARRRNNATKKIYRLTRGDAEIYELAISQSRIYDYVPRPANEIYLQIRPQGKIYDSPIRGGGSTDVL